MSCSSKPWDVVDLSVEATSRGYGERITAFRARAQLACDPTEIQISRISHFQPCSKEYIHVRRERPLSQSILNLWRLQMPCDRFSFKSLATTYSTAHSDTHCKDNQGRQSLFSHAAHFLRPLHASPILCTLWLLLFRLEVPLVAR